MNLPPRGAGYRPKPTGSSETPAPPKGTGGVGHPATPSPITAAYQAGRRDGAANRPPLCVDCPDHEACLQACPCEVVKRVADALCSPAHWEAGSITPHVLSAIRRFLMMPKVGHREADDRCPPPT